MVQHMKGLVRCQFSVIFNKANSGQKIVGSDSLFNPNLSLSWNSMTAEYWKFICQSILILSYSEMFCAAFGHEMVLLQTLLDEVSIHASKISSNSTAYQPCHHCHQSSYRNLHNSLCSYCGRCGECGVVGGTCQCYVSLEVALKFMVRDRALNLENELTFQKRFCIRIPDDLADPAHWGHLAWQYCNFLKHMSVTSTTMVVPP